ncbi:hypothetical protein [Neolewinella persica]|uniref:hypothetical protein n=1 Tax=Neolewinella persica TaxID=70998 RepID=UPI000366F57A|nr:hypothetical protein [Neolewinella persica]
MEAQKKEIADSVSEGNTIQAFELAIKYFPMYASQLVVLRGKFVRLEGRFHAGALGIEKYNQGVADISLDLIEMLSQTDIQSVANKSNHPIKRIINFQMDFLKDVISEFSRSKLILFASLAFVLIVGVTTIVLMSQVMPTPWGKTILSATLFAFLSLVVSSLGFINVQIKQFKGTKSFLKFQEYSDPES